MARKKTSRRITSKQGTRTAKTVSARRKMQTGKKTSKKADSKYKAKYPGKRTTKSGSTYYETRRNRSDASKKTRI